MLDDGVKLYGEADSYNQACGVLLSRLKPVHDDDVAAVRQVYFAAIEGMYYRHYAMVQKYKDGPIYDQKRFAYTITALRRIKNSFRKSVTDELRKHVWKG